MAGESNAIYKSEFYLGIIKNESFIIKFFNKNIFKRVYHFQDE